MTHDQILEIKAAQKRFEEFKKENEAQIATCRANTLGLLENACDHTYPWGDSAVQRDRASAYCQICRRNVRA